LTTGQAWQFKPYKWQDPKVLFRNGEPLYRNTKSKSAVSVIWLIEVSVKGLYFQWSNEPSNPAVKDWNVTEMRVRAKCHLPQSR